MEVDREQCDAQLATALEDNVMPTPPRETSRRVRARLVDLIEEEQPPVPSPPAYSGLETSWEDIAIHVISNMIQSAQEGTQTNYFNGLKISVGKPRTSRAYNGQANLLPFLATVRIMMRYATKQPNTLYFNNTRVTICIAPPQRQAF